MRLHQSQELVVNVLVPYAMPEGVDAGFDQVFGVGQIIDVRDYLLAVLVRFVDDGAVKSRSQFFHLAAAVIHPDLNDVHFLPDQLLHRLARVSIGRHAVGNRLPVVLAGARVGHRHTASRRAKQRGARHRVGAQFVGRVARVNAQVAGGGDAVIGEPVQMVNQVFPRVRIRANLAGLHNLPAKVGVGVNQRRNYGLACKVDTRSAFCRDFALAADLGELAVLNKECRGLDR